MIRKYEAWHKIGAVFVLQNTTIQQKEIDALVSDMKKRNIELVFDLPKKTLTVSVLSKKLEVKLKHIRSNGVDYYEMPYITILKAVKGGIDIVRILSPTPNTLVSTLESLTKIYQKV